MTKINLLPWRAELRKKRQQEFVGALVVAALVGGAVWGGGHFYFADRIDYQQHRNALIEQEIKALEQRIVKIKDLEQTKDRLIARMNVIQQLQQGRSGVVHLFEELATTLPDGLYLTSFKQSANGLALTGTAESNARISSYMEQLDRSGWFADPKLDVIQVSADGQTRLSSFNLRVNQSQPKAEGEEG